MALGVAGARGDGDQEAAVAEPGAVQHLLGSAPGLGTRLEHRAVELLVDAGDLGEAQPRLGLVLRPAAA